MEKSRTHHNTQRLIGYGLISSLAITALVGCEGGKEDTPDASCNDLKAKHIAGRTYEFTTDYSVEGGAKLNSIEYQWGYGQEPKTVFNDDPVQYTFPNGQEYTVYAVPYFYLPGVSDNAEPRESRACSVTIPE